jgi:FkbM family methyltransferase
LSKKRFRFVLRNLMYLRNFDGIVRGLAAQGHRILITTSPRDRKVPPELRELARKLEADYPFVSFDTTQEREDWWAPASRFTRNIGNLLHYRLRNFEDYPALTERVERRAGYVAKLALPRFLHRFPALVRGLSGVIKFIDSGIPADRAIIRELKSTHPDALILSPMVDLETEQLEWVRAARALGIPTCLLVASWDNLTNKGRILLVPDRVVLWNAFQKREAVEMHDVAPERIVVTGAQLYDEWFARRPTRDYETFCRAFGFDPEKPLILYCGSSIFIARDEVDFVREWLEKIRNCDEFSLRQANILVRPHPMHQAPFDEFDVSRYERVTVHPRSGGMPVVEGTKADFFDALHHCTMVVGINTSALIEAAILGKRSFTVADPRYQRTQEGTFHFGYLRSGGILEKAPDFPTHFKQLANELRRGSESKHDLNRFVEAFLRPSGIDKRATPIAVEAVNSVTNIVPQRSRATLPRLVAGTALAPLAFLGALPKRGTEAFLSFSTRLLRFGLFNIARIKECDATSLVARRTPIDYPGKPISILVTSPKENLTRSRSVMSEPWTVHWLERVVAPGDVLYDVGANVGAYSLVAAMSHDREVRVFAFEPSFVTYAALCRNILENDCDKCITPMPVALTERRGNTVFKYRSLVSGAVEHAVGSQNLLTKGFKERKPVYQQRILGIPLDSLIEDFQLDQPDHIKLDVDGAELQVLRGAEATLSRGAVKTVLVDTSDGKDGEKLTDYLKQLGFGVAAKFNGLDGAPGFHAVFARDPGSVAEAMQDCAIPAQQSSAAGEEEIAQLRGTAA